MPNTITQKPLPPKALLIHWEDCAWDGSIQFSRPLNGRAQRPNRLSPQRFCLSRAYSGLEPEFSLTRRFGLGCWNIRRSSNHARRRISPITVRAARKCPRTVASVPPRSSAHHLLSLTALPLRSFPPSRLQIRHVFQATESIL